MMRKEYDTIVIGRGNHGLCPAAYLQRAGMEVAIFERRHEEGGCICTRETAAPGFMQNHAVYYNSTKAFKYYLDERG